MASSLEIAKKAKEAFVDDSFKLAVDLFSEAIDLSPNDANLFADRAQAHLKLNNLTEAAADASKAIEIDPSMAKAYLRKGTACMKLGEYLTAKEALEIGTSLAQNDSRFTKMLKECDQHLVDFQQSTVPASVASKLSDTTAGTLKESKKGCGMSQQISTITSVRPKYSHGYYQKPEEVVVTIYAKGIPANNVVVDFGEQILSVTIGVHDEDAYYFQPRLFGKIIPAKCRYEVLSTKVEIRLAKAEIINWPSLEYSKEIAVTQKVNVLSVESQRPAYPSSMPRKRDWDKLEAQVKQEEKEEKLDGDAGVNRMFQDIYLNADEDMRRAMSKSFMESNGTVLSTDWTDVGSKKVEATAPDDTKSQIETPSSASTLHSMCYQGIKLKWYSGKIVSQSNSISYYPSDNERRYYELTFNKKYLQIVTKYLQYVVSEGREIQLNRTQKWQHTNNPIKKDNNNSKLWTYVVFEHPVTFQTLAMDPKEEENINDLVTFGKEKEYYAKISKAWKRQYLLYGPPGKGKFTMIAAMVIFWAMMFMILNWHLLRITQLMMFSKICNKSIIVFEDIDCSLDLKRKRRW
ncbi:hypothetical protein SO802_002950 [Lithocarpus litseifolius]|uniref:Protein SGT1 homolog n=1 Tax=Lithocarpus litseifolius TaxID=425828 RepID=A0AAW2DZK6_9ROSI